MRRGARVMSNRIIRAAAAAIAAAGLLAGAPAGAQGQRPNQRGSGRPNGAAATARPPAPVLYLSPAGVRAVQRALQAAGEKPGRVDGVWDDGSTKALASYQGKKGIDP